MELSNFLTTTIATVRSIANQQSLYEQTPCKEMMLNILKF